MDVPTPDGLAAYGLLTQEAQALVDCFPPEADPDGSETWTKLRQLLRPEQPFELHQLLFDAAYSHRDPSLGPAPAWAPTAADVASGTPGDLLAEDNNSGVHRASAADPQAWWSAIIQHLGIHFRTPPSEILDATCESPGGRWLPGARLNIAESCFEGRDMHQIAVVWSDEGGDLQTLSLAELRRRSNQVAWGLQALGLLPGDAVAACMPMTVDSVAIYLGIVLAGGVVVSVADNFGPEEIATRLRISGARAIFTQDVIRGAGRELPLYERVVAAEAPRAIVLPAGERVSIDLRSEDLDWEEFCSQGASEDHFEPCIVPADTPTNILFSSGATGEPKAIPWTHITPIKAAADGWAHHDIRPGDVVAWPTNPGWLMGPWLIYASLLGGAAIAIFDGTPTGKTFCRFVGDAGVTMLGLVPSIVRAWRANGAPEGSDWSRIRCFSSTGEASDPKDSLWLMSRVPGYRPVVEYCAVTASGWNAFPGTTTEPVAE